MTSFYNTYHTDLKIAEQIGILPGELREKIPSGTRAYWKKQNLSGMIGFPDTGDIEKKVDILCQVANNNTLFQMTSVLVRVNRILHTVVSLGGKFTSEVQEKIIRLEGRFRNSMDRDQFLHWLGISRQKFQYWSRNKKKCASSLNGLCRRRNPNQIAESEILEIRRYLKNERFSHWPLRSIFYQMLRDGKTSCSESTFYNYAKWLGFSGRRGKYKVEKIGIRALKAGEILHADVTIAILFNNVKIYIYVLMDNFSRCILSIRASEELSAKTCIDNIKKGIDDNRKFLNNKFSILVDGGSENKGEVDEYIAENSEFMEKIVAQKDITFSNSMVEALNKILKLDYIKDRQFANVLKIQDFLDYSKFDFNNRPHGSLYGLTPLEALHGKIPYSRRYFENIGVFMAKRIEENRVFDCEKCLSLSERE